MKNVKVCGIPRQKDEVHDIIPRLDSAVKTQIPLETVGPSHRQTVFTVTLLLLKWESADITVPTVMNIVLIYVRQVTVSDQLMYANFTLNVLKGTFYFCDEYLKCVSLHYYYMI